MGIIGQVISTIGAGRQNRKNIEYARENRDIQHEWDRQSYERQRKDALDDYERQNRYNSPAQQMQRFKEAGINPHAQFAQGRGENTGGVIRSSTPSRTSTPPPQMTSNAFEGFSTVNPMDELGKYIAVKQGQQNVNKTAAETELLLMEQVTKGIDQIGKMIDNTNKQLDSKEKEIRLKYLDEIQMALINKYKVESQSTAAGTVATQDANKRANQLQPGAIQKQAQEIIALKASSAKTKADKLNVEQMTKNAAKTEQLQALELRLKEAGLDGSDPLYIKAVVRYLNYGYENASEYINELLDARKK